MTLKTLDATAKQAFTSAGVTLTPAQEHIAAEKAAAGINWANVIAELQKIGSFVGTLLPIILALLGGQTPPTPPSPTPAQATGALCCNHHACCLKTFEKAVATVKAAGEHLAECCCCCNP